MKIIKTILLLPAIWFSVSYFLGGYYAIRYDPINYDKAVSFAHYDNDIVRIFTNRTMTLMNLATPQLKLIMLAKLLNENERVAGNNLRINANLVSLYLLVGDKVRAQKTLNKMILLSPGRIETYKKMYE